MTETFRLTREIPVDSGYDVVVAGGGPAGVAAAVCAARLGARVLLVEATGCLGGMGTAGLVSNWSNLSDGERPVIGGLMREILEAMHARGHLPPNADPAIWTKSHNDGVGFSAEGLKVLLDELCVKAGVEIRYFTRVIDVEADREARVVRAVVLHNIEGYRMVPVRAVVDATGDAVVTAMCGAAVREAGRDTPHIMPPTLCAVQTNLEGEGYTHQIQQAAVLKAIADGFFSQPDRHVPGLFRTGRSTAIMNAGHLFKTNALNCRSLSDAMIRGRQFAAEFTAFYRQYLPACRQMELAATAALLGVRESRRIVGEYELNYDDFKARRRFPDDIAIYCKQVDIHVYDQSPEEYERYRKEFEERDTLAPGEHYGIPYRIIVPKGWRNLWTPGRSNSSDLKVNGAIRDQPAAMMMGQAAGTAAVQSLRTGQPSCWLDTVELVRTLKQQGANLP